MCICYFSCLDELPILPLLLVGGVLILTVTTVLTSRRTVARLFFITWDPIFKLCRLFCSCPFYSLVLRVVPGICKPFFFRRMPNHRSLGKTKRTVQTLSLVFLTKNSVDLLFLCSDSWLLSPTGYFTILAPPVHFARSPRFVFAAPAAVLSRRLCGITSPLLLWFLCSWPRGVPSPVFGAVFKYDAFEEV